jgi:hypothetical protein
VCGQLAPSGEEAAAGGAGVARLPGHVVHLHVLDQVTPVAERLEAKLALVTAAGQLTAVGQNEAVRLPKF